MRININNKIIALAVIAAIIFGLCDISLRMFGGNYSLSTAGALEYLLGIPGSKSKDKAIKASDIMHLTEEEWNTPACYPMDKVKCEHTGFDAKCIKIPVNEMAPLKDCVYIGMSTSWPEPYCNHWTSINCDSIYLYDYILQRPDLLNKIIEILKRPCHYLPKEEDFEDKGIDYSYIKQIKDDLECNKKEDRKPRMFVLRILTRNWKRSFSIVVNREE